MLDISAGGIVPVPKRSALKTPGGRELSERLSFCVGTLLAVAEQMSLDSRVKGLCRGCGIHTALSVVHGC